MPPDRLQSDDSFSREGRFYADETRRGVAQVDKSSGMAELIALVGGSAAREQIVRVVGASNESIRGLLRAETGLRFTPTAAARVTVEDGMPIRLWRIVETIPSVVWRLQMMRAEVSTSVQTLEVIERLQGEMPRELPSLGWSENATRSTSEVRNMLAELLRLVLKSDLVALLKQIDEDVALLPVCCVCESRT